jgi:hypothetical protein
MFSVNRKKVVAAALLKRGFRASLKVVLNLSFVHLMLFSAENPGLRQAAKH